MWWNHKRPCYKYAPPNRCLKSTWSRTASNNRLRTRNDDKKTLGGCRVGSPKPRSRSRASQDVWSVRKPSDSRIAGDEREELSGKVVEMLHPQPPTCDAIMLAQPGRNPCIYSISAQPHRAASRNSWGRYHRLGSAVLLMDLTSSQ